MSKRLTAPGPLAVRPPGSLSEEEFLARCIRCSQCMKVCPTSGLQPLTVLSVIYIKKSVRPTLKNLAETGQGFAKKQAEAWTAGWKGAEEERAAVPNGTSPGLAVIILIP